MSKSPYHIMIVSTILIILSIATSSSAWHDETHIAVAKASGYHKWYNAAGADITKLKAGNIERHNHYVHNHKSVVITPEMVFGQINKYNAKYDFKGHLYGAIIASVRNYLEDKKGGKYAEYRLAFCSHYVGDLSMPLHNTAYNLYNRKYHAITDGIINDEVLGNLDKIKIYPIKIESEDDLAREIARIANLSLKKGYQIEDENRLLTKEEAYEQISHSASLFKAILRYVEKQPHTK